MRLPLLFLCIVIKCTLPHDTAYSVRYSFVEGLNERILDYPLSVFFLITSIVAWLSRSVRREETKKSGSYLIFCASIVDVNTLTAKATYLSGKFYSSLAYRRGFPLPIHIGRFNRGEWFSPLHRYRQNHHCSFPYFR